MVAIKAKSNNGNFPGFQCHLSVGQVPNTLQQNLQRFADLGLDVAITELDINIHGPTSNATALAQQAEDFYTVVSACKAVSRCVSVVSLWEIWSMAPTILKPFDRVSGVSPMITAGS